MRKLDISHHKRYSVGFKFDGFNYFFDGHIFYWCTSDGKEIAIHELESSHIQNIIRLLERKQEDSEYEELIEIFESELIKRKNRIKNIFQKSI